MKRGSGSALLGGYSESLAIKKYNTLPERVAIYIGLTLVFL